MGKQKRQRRKPHKENPTGLPSVKDFEETEAEDCANEDRETALQRVYEQIQSPTIEEKLSGLQTLESMSCDPAMAIQIAKDGIAKMIGPLLIDQSVPVRAGSASAIRCIADNGKKDAYICLLKDDIMTPLSALLKQYYTEWKPKPEQKEKGKIDDEKEALTQAVTLLWTLCENNESAVKYSNEENLSSVLMKFFDVTTYGMDIATVAAQCLLALSEDNPTAIKILKECERSLIDLLNLEAESASASELASLKTAVAGLLMNLTSCTDNNPMSTVCKVITVLSETLAIGSKQLLDSLTSILPHEKNNFSSSAKKKVQESRRIFGAQQQALEILANLCSEDQDTDNDSDLNESDEEECEMESPEEMSTDEKSYKMISTLPLEIVEVFGSCDTVKKVWGKTTAVDKDTVEILEQNVEGRAVLKQMHTLRCRAYLCLNNLMSSLEIDALGGLEFVYRLWIEIGIVIFKNTEPSDIELLESATAAMRATLQRLSEAKANIFNQLTLADVQPMLNGERQCPNANVRANLIRILGSLSLTLMNTDTTEARELIKHISTFLLDTCTVETEAWVMAESLDAIMDVYAEDDSDQLASEIQLVDKLHTLAPVFKNKMRQQKRNFGDNAAIVSTVNSNIMRFIKYKGKRIKSIS